MAAVADIEYLAVFNAGTGEFMDLVRSDESGLSFRANKEWREFAPGDFSLDGHEIIDVDEAFTAIADGAQAARTKPTLEQAQRHVPFDGKAPQ